MNYFLLSILCLVFCSNCSVRNTSSSLTWKAILGICVCASRSQYVLVAVLYHGFRRLSEPPTGHVAARWTRWIVNRIWKFYGNWTIGCGQKNRTDSWVNYVNVLFVDNPVGTGFSYVNDTRLLAQNNSQIATDLTEFMKQFLNKVPEFQTVPFYVFSESYGGKMTAQFALSLYKQITLKKVKCAFKGIALGDSWISPVDSVLSWGPYLYATSLVDGKGLDSIMKAANACKTAVDKGKLVDATQLWSLAESIVEQNAGGVDFYNILRISTAEVPKVGKTLKDNLAHLYARHVAVMEADKLKQLMNGPIKDMLRIIPANVTWGAQTTDVFQALSGDFMRPVVNVVERLLNYTEISVNIYSGQLDLIVDTLGTMKWVEGMKWPGIQAWFEASRTPMYVNNQTEGFSKSYKNFAVYWILGAGHLVPADNPAAAAKMLSMITNLK